MRARKTLCHFLREITAIGNQHFIFEDLTLLKLAYLHKWVPSLNVCIQVHAPCGFMLQKLEWAQEWLALLWSVLSQAQYITSNWFRKHFDHIFKNLKINVLLCYKTQLLIVIGECSILVSGITVIIDFMTVFIIISSA